jgi:hypothetical protein
LPQRLYNRNGVTHALMSEFRSLSRSRDEPKAFPTRWDYGLLLVAIVATVGTGVLAWLFM